MTARQTQFLLYSTAAILFAGAAAVLAVGFSRPLELPVPEVQSAAPVIAVNRPESVEKYTAILSRPLQQLDIAKPLAGAPTTAPTELSLTLVGTVGQSLALFRTAEGVVEVRAVGEVLAGAEVISVSPSRVEVLFNGKRMTLIKPNEDG